jgi:transposase
VHADTIAVCILDGEMVLVDRIVAHDPEVVIGLLGEHRVRRCCQEAGPTGFELHRALEGAGFDSIVVAPGKIPRQASDRIKTDRRDARKLAQLLAAGLLTGIFVPPRDSEAIRSLVRARDDLRRDRYRARQRLTHYLLKHRLRPPTGSWGPTRYGWLHGLTFDHGPDQITFGDYLHAVELIDKRLERMDREIEWLADHSKYAPLVGRLRCLRGVSSLTALAIASEIGDFTRFRRASEFQAFVGLVPSEHSSGQHVMRGKLTKSGNGHVRRLLVEAAWNTRRRPQVSYRLSVRQIGQPAWAVDHAWKCQHRLYKRWNVLIGRRKHPNTAVCAIARELAGFIWAIAIKQPIVEPV